MIRIKKNYLSVCVFLSFLIAMPNFAYGNDWVSPIDEKYKSKDSKQFSKLLEARGILNSWSGQGTKLVKAEKILKEILKADDRFAPAYREVARLVIMRGFIKNDEYEKNHLQVAEEKTLKSIEIEPEYADSYVLLVHIYTLMKDYDKAQDALIKAGRIGTQIPWYYLNWADLLEAQGKYTEALELYEYILDSGTNNKKAYEAALSKAAMTNVVLKNYEVANELYKKQIENDPENAWYWGNYASFLLYKYNDADGAIKSAKKALSIMDYGMARFTLACALYTKWAQLKKDPNTQAEAGQYFEKAWALYPYPEAVIKETTKFKSTRTTANALRHWNHEHNASKKEDKTNQEAVPKRDYDEQTDSDFLNPIPTKGYIQESFLLDYFGQLEIQLHAQTYEELKAELPKFYDHHTILDFHRVAQTTRHFQSCDQSVDLDSRVETVSQNKNQYIDSLFPNRATLKYDTFKYKVTYMEVNQDLEELEIDYILHLGGDIYHKLENGQINFKHKFLDKKKCKAVFLYPDNVLKMKFEKCDVVLEEVCEVPN